MEALLEWLHAELLLATRTLEYWEEEIKENSSTARYYINAYTFRIQCLQDIINELGAYQDLKKPMDVNAIFDGFADGYPVYDTATCPNCGRAFELDHEEEYKHCPDCGQRLRWSDDA